ncbi:ROK family protein [Paenibacillus psychroresistens]|uniref:ROK family protein n=1 Tax=Paenibacillus psychroresistens TaxID=1778678 RepID=A0A6B8RPT2_9BACL|nr:ROK family protein [Paenibacillus psychroresistens]QGQ97702.1 ROK family protein [Paenibacillus psychroresistens]
MNKGIYLAFDVGGTSIKAGVIDVSGRILEHTLSHYESKANGSAAEIVDHFVKITNDLLQQADPNGLERIAGIGYAFPGPFDYEQGISYIQGLNKFESLFGKRFGDQLLEAMRSNSSLASRLKSDFMPRFANDAALFAIGEAHYGQAAAYRRVVCLTLGTGIGSSFIEAGRLIKHRDDVPDNGWVYPLPYRSSIVDDYISRRGLLLLAREMGIDLLGRDVKQLAEGAIRGDEALNMLFDSFGRCIAEALAAALKIFNPDIVVLGGQISKSGELFVPSLCRELLHRGVQASVVISTDTLRNTLLGIYHTLQEDLGDEANDLG